MIGIFAFFDKCLAWFEVAFLKRAPHSPALLVAQPVQNLQLENGIGLCGLTDGHRRKSVTTENKPPILKQTRVW